MCKPLDHIEERVARTEWAARRLLRPIMKTDMFFNQTDSNAYIEIHTRTALKDMLPDQRANLLHSLLDSYDPGLDNPDYEAYQSACEVILRRVDHVRESKDDAS